jgi:serine/threonine protein kinase
LKNKNDINDFDNRFSNEEFSIDPSKILGTENYMAPEIINEDVITKEVDYWALGVLIYELFTGKLPFGADSTSKTFENILNVNINWSFFESLNLTDNNAQDLIMKLLIVNPQQRWGSKNVDQIKQHPFFSNFDWKNVKLIRDPLVIKHVKTRIDDFNKSKPKVVINESNIISNSNTDDVEDNIFCKSVVKNLDRKNRDILKSDLRQNKFDFGSHEKLIDIMSDII